MPLNVLGNPGADDVGAPRIDALDGHIRTACLQANKVSDLERHSAPHWTTLCFALTATVAATALSERGGGAGKRLARAVGERG